MRTAHHDWQLEWSESRNRVLIVRDAATDTVLDRLYEDIPIVGAAADPDQGFVCAILSSGPPANTLVAVGWDLDGARELWRQSLPDDEPRYHDFYRAIVVGERCILEGRKQELSLRVGDGSVEPLPFDELRRASIAAEGFIDLRASDGTAVVRTAEGWGHRIRTTLALDTATRTAIESCDRDCTSDVPAITPHLPPATHWLDFTWATRDALWYQNRDGIVRQRLDVLTLPQRVNSHSSEIGQCQNASEDVTVCYQDAGPALTFLEDGREVDRTAIPACKAGGLSGPTLDASGAFAARCGDVLFMGVRGGPLRVVRGLHLSYLGYRFVGWVRVGGEPRLIVDDFERGVMALDPSGALLWRRELRAQHAGVAPGNLIYADVDDEILFLDPATGAERARVPFDIPIMGRLAVVGDALIGRHADEPGFRIERGPKGWSVVARVSNMGLGYVNGYFNGTYLLSTPDFGAAASSIASPDGRILARTRVLDGGAYVIANDGTFACEGSGCDVLRCTVGRESRPIDDAACAELRRDHWELAALDR